MNRSSHAHWKAAGNGLQLDPLDHRAIVGRRLAWIFAPVTQLAIEPFMASPGGGCPPAAIHSRWGHQAVEVGHQLDVDGDGCRLSSGPGWSEHVTSRPHGWLRATTEVPNTWGLTPATCDRPDRAAGPRLPLPLLPLGVLIRPGSDGPWLIGQG